jgi:hypothetical protein
MADDKKLALLSYIDELDSSCLYKDGYVCAEDGDPNFYSQEAQRAMLPAGYFKAWNPAYDKFLSLSELTDKQKDLKHYKIGFAQEEEQYVVLFSPLLLPYFEQGKANGLSTGVYGMSVKVWVDKKTLSVSKQLFLK